MEQKKVYYNWKRGIKRIMENILVLTDKEQEGVTQEELKEVLQYNDGDLERFKDYTEKKMIWGYLCKIPDYFKYALLDMDKVILFLDEVGDVYSYEHTGNYGPEHKKDKEVVGIMDENTEITPC